MKSIRRAILGNQEYHHNLLGEEFEGLVEEATDKTLPRPDAEANQNVILAINDPNTGMELTPTRISQQLRKALRSTHPQKQWLATELIRDVLAECSSHLQSVLLEILEALSVVATMDASASTQATKNAKQVAMEILGTHGHAGQQALRGRFGTADIHRVPPGHIAPSQHKEPEKSLKCIQRYEQSCLNHCAVVRDLITSGEMHETTHALIRELMSEVKEMRQRLAQSVEVLAGHEGTAVEEGIVKGFHVIDAADKVLELHEKGISPPTELTLRNMAGPPKQSTSRSLDLLGEKSVMEEEKEKLPRSRSSDLFGLDSLEAGLRQSNVLSHSKKVLERGLFAQGVVDPFQCLANGEDPGAASSSQLPPSQSSANPFADTSFSF